MPGRRGPSAASSAGLPPARTTRRSAKQARRCRIGRAAPPSGRRHRASSAHARHSVRSRNGQGAGPRRSRASSASISATTVSRILSRQASIAISRSWSKGESRSERNSRMECRSKRRRHSGIACTGIRRTEMSCRDFSQRFSATAGRPPVRVQRERPPPHPRWPENGSGASRTPPAPRRTAGGADAVVVARPCRASMSERSESRSARFAPGLVKLDDRQRRIGRGLGNLDDFLRSRHFAGEQRIGEHFLERRRGPARFAVQFLEIELVCRGQLQEQLHGQRTLVALDQVEIGRRNAKPFRHRGLGEPKLVADAANARAGEDLLLSHLQLFTSFGAAYAAFTIVTKLQAHVVKGNTA